MPGWLHPGEPADFLAPCVVTVESQLGVSHPELSCTQGEDGTGWVCWSAGAALTEYQGVGGLQSRH